MTVGIVGLGLIGGSVGLALREPGRTILGYDPSPSNSSLAVERFCVDRLATLEEVAQAEVVFVAAPPQAVVGMLERLASLRSPGTVITDCTSVKGAVMAWADRAKANWFVGGHPMAGHEKTGPGYASAWMYRNARWILTPTRTTDRNAVKTVETLIKSMGAVPVKADPESHDRQVAILSHLPHAFAAVLVTLGAELERTDVSGGSWRDLTRVGGVDPDLWAQIFCGNRDAITKVLADSEHQLAQMRQALEAEDYAGVREIFARAKLAKSKQEA